MQQQQDFPHSRLEAAIFHFAAGAKLKSKCASPWLGQEINGEGEWEKEEAKAVGQAEKTDRKTRRYRRAGRVR